MNQIRPLIATAALAASLAPHAATAQPVDSLRPVQRVEIVVPAHQAFVGTALHLDARVYAKGDTAPDESARVFWEASNLTGAWVTDSGTVLLFEPGEISIVARSGSVSATRWIVVKENPITRVKISGTPSAPIAVGDTIAFSAVLAGRWGEAINGVQPNWAISLGSAATYGAGARVAADGRFHATEPGAYTVVAEMNGRADVAQVIVRAPAGARARPDADVDPAQRIEIPPPGARAYAGTTLPLRAAIKSLVSGKPTYGALVTWTSSDATVASIAADGALALHRPGRTVVTAEHAGKKATRVIRVEANPAGRIVLHSDTRDAAPGAAVLLRTDIWARGARVILDARPNIAVIAHDAAPGDVVPGVDGEGRFVPAKAGVYTVIAEMGGLASRTTITVRDPGFGRR